MVKFTESPIKKLIWQYNNMVYTELYIRLKIKPNSDRIRFESCQILFFLRQDIYIPDNSKISTRKRSLPNTKVAVGDVTGVGVIFAVLT